MASRLLQAEREARVLELLSGTPGRTIHELADALSVSSATVRRDLSEMEQRGLLTRVHGGATLTPRRHVEPLFTAKEGENRSAKEGIARAAEGLVADHDTLYLDGGSTVLLLARLLAQHRGLTIVTNSLMAAWTLMEADHRLILVGGEFRGLSRTLVGPLTEHVIGALTVSKAFMGTMGLTVGEGMTTTDVNEAFTKQQIMARAATVVLLADHSKMGVPSFARSGSLDDIDVLVTDRIDPSFREQLETHGVQVVLADGKEKERHGDGHRHAQAGQHG
ncbi:MAG: DeoR/GlpR transcriptional regulator [Lentisphaeria bacterium]|nr:DeoR/GlpR transcriptional regulator [Lentisphaeria bacterium]